ncbi:hypothetical protein, partial [Micromonospora harpali]
PGVKPWGGIRSKSLSAHVKGRVESHESQTRRQVERVLDWIEETHGAALGKPKRGHPIANIPRPQKTDSLVLRPLRERIGTVRRTAPLKESNRRT